MRDENGDIQVGNAPYGLNLRKVNIHDFKAIGLIRKDYLEWGDTHLKILEDQNETLFWEEELVSPFHLSEDDTSDEWDLKDKRPGLYEISYTTTRERESWEMNIEYEVIDEFELRKLTLWQVFKVKLTWLIKGKQVRRSQCIEDQLITVMSESISLEMDKVFLASLKRQ